MENTPMLVIIIILFICENICLYIYCDKYPDIFNYQSLMKEICFHENNKNTYIVNEFEKIFGQFCDEGKFVYSFDPREIITNGFSFMVSLLSLIGILVATLLSRIFNYKIFSLLFLVLSMTFNAYNIITSFREDGVNLQDSKIYIYNEEFNNQIREGLDYAFNRAKYLKATSFIVLIIILIEMPLLICLKENNNNKGKLIMLNNE